MLKPKVVIFYKTKGSQPGKHNPYGAGGLSSNAIHSVGVLRSMGIDASLRQVQNFFELFGFLKDNPDITHAIVEAVWLTLEQAEWLAATNKNMQIVVRAHSKMGFLQVEPEAIPVVRGLIKLHTRRPNLHFSSNNEEFCESLAEAYGGRVLYLPNLYDLSASPPRRQIEDEVLRIGSFGATRLLKLHPSAALAALQIARRLDSKLEFYINVDSTPGGDSVRRTIRNMFADLPRAKLVELSWQDSDVFKETVASMDLLLQLSATETFCMVAADAVSSGVPAIVGPAISWMPERYQADIDDTDEVASMGVHAIMHDRRVVRCELNALQDFVAHAKLVWADYLGLPRKRRHLLWWLL